MSNILTRKDLDLLFSGNNKNKHTIKRRMAGGDDPEVNAADVKAVLNNAAATLSDTSNNVDVPASDATSDAGVDTSKEMAIEQTIPEAVSKVWYHIVPDSDYGEMISKKVDRPAVIFGKIALNKERISARLPVLSDPEESEKVAAKLTNMMVAKGSCGVENDSKYPYLGVVVVGLKFKNREVVTSQHIDIEQGDETKPNYDLLTTDKNLAYYEVRGKTRGTIAKEALENTEIVSAKYIVRKDVNPDNAFGFLNILVLLKKLTVQDVQDLRCLYNGEKKNCYGHGSAKEKEKVVLKIDVESRGEVDLVGVSGGRYNNEQILASKEKAKYLLNKQKKQNGGNSNIDEGDFEEFYKKMYLRKKSQYIKLKQQKGGKSLNDDDGDDQPTENEDYWKPKYLAEKAKYMSLKRSHLRK